MPSKTQWKYGLKGARAVRQRRPVITGNTVLATFNHGQGANLQATLCAIDFETGDEQWRFEAKLILNEPRVSQDGHIFITCFDGSITLSLNYDQMGPSAGQFSLPAGTCGPELL